MRFDICEAYYLFAVQWHEGQGSKTYGILARLARIGFKARPSLRERVDLTEEGRDIYDRLVP